MNVAEAISRIHAPKGVTSLISGVVTGDFAPIRGPGDVSGSLLQARAALERTQDAQNKCKSDWAYWGYEGDLAYLRAVVNILEAAEIVGPDNLPDVTFDDRGVVVMDVCARVEEFGLEVLRLAKEKTTTPGGGDE